MTNVIFKFILHFTLFSILILREVIKPKLLSIGKAKTVRRKEERFFKWIVWYENIRHFTPVFTQQDNAIFINLLIDNVTYVPPAHDNEMNPLSRASFAISVLIPSLPFYSGIFLHDIAQLLSPKIIPLAIILSSVYNKHNFIKSFRKGGNTAILSLYANSDHRSTALKNRFLKVYLPLMHHDKEEKEKSCIDQCLGHFYLSSSSF